MKKGGMELSFGMIFAIILIAVFIFVAFYAIKFFLNMQCTVSEGQFVKDLNNYAHRMWESQGITEESEFKGTIGGFCGVKEVCFFNPDMEKPQRGEFTTEYDEIQKYYNDIGDNMFFYPINEEFNHAKIENLNLEGLNPNPYCITFEEGKASIWLKKNSQEELVRVVIG